MPGPAPLDTAPRERELKLVFPLACAKAMKVRLDEIAGPGGRRRAAARMISTYFDTDALDLKRAGVSLRLRRQGRSRVQTLKQGGGAGLFDRLERERRATGEQPQFTAEERAELDAILGGPLPEDRPLGPIFETEVRRTIFDVRRTHTAVEIALDNAAVAAGDVRLAFWEIEIELKAGEASGLFDIARELANAGPLRLGVLSKSARGHALRSADETTAVMAEESPVRPGMDVEAAFLAIVVDCVTQFRRNEDVLLETPEPKAVHQARVGLRRLRSAFSLFRDAVADARSEALAAELKWLAGSLGDARDIDVLIEERLEPASQDASDETVRSGAAGLVSAGGARRDDAYRRALDALQSSRALALMIDLTEWTAVGAWRTASHSLPLRAGAIEAFAAETLETRLKKLKKRARRLAEVTPEERHDARIQAKKLRYATEFFAPLYTGGKAAERHDRFQDLLKKLQNELGALNDIETARGLTLGLSRDVADAADAAFAAGFVCGGAEAHVPQLIAAAAKRYGKLKTARPFWR